MKIKELQHRLERLALELRCADCLEEVACCEAEICDITTAMVKLKRAELNPKQL